MRPESEEWPFNPGTDLCAWSALFLILRSLVPGLLLLRLRVCHPQSVNFSRAPVGLAAHFAPLSACTREPTETGRMHRQVGARPGQGEPLPRDRRQFVLASSLQTFVIAAQTPDIVGVLT